MNKNRLDDKDIVLTGQYLGVVEEFLPEAYISSSITKIGDFDTSAIINNDNILDLSEIIRQCALLSIPIKPLCNPNCIGLCAICGQNLNDGTCICLKNTNLEAASNTPTASHSIERRIKSNGTIA